MHWSGKGCRFFWLLWLSTTESNWLFAKWNLLWFLDLYNVLFALLMLAKEYLDSRQLSTTIYTLLSSNKKFRNYIYFTILSSFSKIYIFQTFFSKYIYIYIYGQSWSFYVKHVSSNITQIITWYIFYDDSDEYTKCPISVRKG